MNVKSQILWLRLGHQVWKKRLWLFFVIAATALGYEVSHNDLIPIYTTVNSDHFWRLACRPGLCPIAAGDTIVSKSGQGLRVLLTGQASEVQETPRLTGLKFLPKAHHQISLEQLDQNQALLLMVPLASQAQAHDNFKFEMFGSEGKNLSMTLNIRGLLQEKISVMDSLRLWNRLLDSADNFDPKPKVRINYQRNGKILTQGLSDCDYWLVQSLVGTKNRSLICVDSVAGILKSYLSLPW